MWKEQPREGSLALRRVFCPKKIPTPRWLLTQALIARRCGLESERQRANREECLFRMLSRSEYVVPMRSDRQFHDRLFRGSRKGDVRPAPGLQRLLRYNATYPFYSDAIWYF